MLFLSNSHSKHFSSVHTLKALFLHRLSIHSSGDVLESIKYYCQVSCLLQYQKSAGGAVEKHIQYRCIMVEDQEKYW